MLRLKTSFISTNVVHYHRGSAYYVIPGEDEQDSVDIDDDDKGYCDNVLSYYYEYNNDNYNLIDYEEEG